MHRVQEGSLVRVVGFQNELLLRRRDQERRRR